MIDWEKKPGFQKLMSKYFSDDLNDNQESMIDDFVDKWDVKSFEIWEKYINDIYISNEKDFFDYHWINDKYDINEIKEAFLHNNINIDEFVEIFKGDQNDFDLFNVYFDKNYFNDNNYKYSKIDRKYLTIDEIERDFARLYLEGRFKNII